MKLSFFSRILSLKAGAQVFVVLAALVAGMLIAKTYWDSRVFQGYDATLPLEPEIVLRENLGGFRAEKVQITGLRGERIPLRIILPRDSPHSRYRCVVFLYGIGQNMRFFEKIAPIFAARGVAMAMPEQFDRGERRGHGTGMWQKAAAFRARASRIVPETRRVVDYLAQRADIDLEAIDFIGVSYGGIMGCAVLAHEPRLRCGTLIMAGGDFRKLLTSMASRHYSESAILWPAAAEAAAWFVSPFDPLHYIGKVAPRPLLFLNVEDDELIDRACTQALFDAAGKPKKEIWYGVAHDAITEETVRQMMGDVLNWMEQTEAQSRGVSMLNPGMYLRLGGHGNLLK